MTAYFGGQVVHQTVPLIVPDPALPAGDMPARKRLHLPQGDLAQIHNSPEPIHFIAWIELKAGGIRGNHIHRRKQEYLYLLAGSATLTLEHAQTRERVTLDLAVGDLVLIEPGIAHAIASPVAGEAIEYSPQAFDPADTERYPLTSA